MKSHTQCTCHQVLQATVPLSFNFTLQYRVCHGPVTLSGYKRYAEDVSMMIGKKPNIWFQICWIGISPAALFVRVLIAIGRLSLTKLWSHETCSPQQAEL